MKFELEVFENRLVVGRAKHHLPGTHDRVLEGPARPDRKQARRTRGRLFLFGSLVGGDGFEPPTSCV
jgi:hypothetical protein